MEALKLHRTQVDPDGPFFSGAESGHAFWGEEFYVLVKGERGPLGEHGYETDLFAGL
jgi:N-acetyl-1-D-myo-inositol-2-amino-2-deoxy-alpha-D-glucopyranoside deacetylase